MTTTGSSESANRLTLRSAFYGSSGLRAGWRALGFFVLLFAAVESLLPYTLKVEREVFGSGETPGGVVLQKILLFGCTLLCTIIFGVFEKRSLADYGLPLRKIFGKDFWAGSLWGFGILSVNVALMILFRAYSIGTIALPAFEGLKYATLWAVAYLAVGIAEEFTFRGYLQYMLTQAVGFWPAAAVTSILFGLVHLDVHAPWQAIANISLLALFVCMSLRRTGNLWFAIGCHMAFDWGESFYFSIGSAQVQGHLLNAYVHGSEWVTGGGFGLEGNIFNIFLVAAAIFLLSRVYPRLKYPAEVSEPRANN